MPETNDLGTAHGKIKITADTRGINDAEKGFSDWEATMQDFKKSLAQNERILTQLENTVGDLGKQLKAADNSMGQLNKTTTIIHKSNGKLSKSVNILNADFDNLIERLQKAIYWYGKLGNPVKLSVNFAKQIHRNTDDLTGFNKALVQSGVAMTGLRLSTRLLVGRLLGLNEAISNVQGWKKDFLNLSGSVLAVVGGVKLFNKVTDDAASKFGRKFITLIGKQLNQGQLEFDNFRQFASNSLRKIGQDNKAAGLDAFFRKLNLSVDKGRISLKNFGAEARRADSELRVAAKGTETFVKSMRNFIIGGAIAKTAFGYILKPLLALRKIGFAPLAAILAGMGAIAPTLEALGKTVTWLSDVLLGALDAVKQLGSGILALPAGIASLLTVVGTLALGLNGLGDAFKAAFEKSDEDFTKALDDLDGDDLKDVARGIREVKDQWKDLQKSVRGQLLNGFKQDTQDITKTYVPLLTKGMGGVAKSINLAKNELVSFATDKGTVNDLGLSFLYTDRIVRGLRDQIKPLGGAILDVVVGGQQAISGLTGTTDGLVKKFADWAKVNRENGNMSEWIYDGVTAVRQLYKGMSEALDATWNLLTAFKRSGGENGIQTFTNAMVKFNAAIDKSKATGFIATLNRAIDGLGTEKLKQLKDLFSDEQGFSFNPFNHLGPTTGVMGLLEEAIPLVRDFSEGFGSYMVPALKTAMGLLAQIAGVIDDLGLDTLIGKIIGFAVAWRFVDKAIAPFLKTGVIMIGITKSISGISNAMAALSTVAVVAMRNLGMAGVAERFNSLSSAVSRWSGRALIAIGAVVAIWQSYQSTVEQIAGSKDALKQSEKDFTEWRHGLDKSFLDDHGIVGKTVIDKIADGIESGRSNLDAAAESSATSMWDHFKGFFATAGGKTSLFVDDGKGPAPTLWFSDPKYLNDLQELEAKAKSTQEGLDELGLSNDELAAKLSSDSGYESVSRQLEAMGAKGAEALAFVQKYRGEIERLQEVYNTAGSDKIMAVEGIQALAEAGGDATQKLKGLEQVLKGLGLLKTDAQDAIFAQAEAVNTLRDAASELVDASAPLGDSINFFGPDGFLNGDSANAKNLYQGLSEAAGSLRDIKSQGGDVAAAYQNIVDTFGNLANVFKIDPAAIRSYFDNFLAGAGTANLPINLDPKLAELPFDQLLPKLEEIRRQAQGLPPIEVPTVPALPGLGADPTSPSNADSWDKLMLPPDPIPVPMKPVIAPNTPPVKDVIAPPTAPPVPVPVAPTAPPKNAADLLIPASPTSPNQAPEIPKPTAGEQANATQAYTQPLMDAVKQASALGAEVSNEYAKGMLSAVGAVTSAAQGLVTQAESVLGPLNYQRFYNGGATLGQAFAQGILSKVDSVRQAALDLMNAGSAPIPNSPAKIGPFSGQGWTLHRGRRFAEDFASGVDSGASAASGATGAMMGDSSLTMDQGIAQFLKDITDLTGFGKSLFDLANSLADIAFSAAELFTTDWKTGESTLQRTFKKTVSDDELARKRADDFQSGIGNRDGNNTLDFNKLPSDLKNLPKGNAKGSEEGLTQSAKATRRLVSAMFPQIEEIGGVRADSLQWHPSGRGLDFMIPGGDTSGGRNPEGKVLGDKIDAFLLANKEALGINHVLWQTMEGGNHFNHVHAGFNEGGGADLSNIIDNATAIADKNAEDAKTAAEDKTVDSTQEVELSKKDKELIANQGVIDSILKVAETLGSTPDETAGALAAALNRNTGTSPEDAARDFLGAISQVPAGGSFNERAAAAFGGNVPKGFMDDLLTSSRAINDNLGLTNEELSSIDGNTLNDAKSNEELYKEYLAGNPGLEESIRLGQDPKATDEQRLQSVNDLETVIKGLPTDTAAQRALKDEIGSQQSSIMEAGGITDQGTPLDQAKSLFGSISGIAGDVFAVIDQSIKSVEAAHDLTSTLVRGIENTGDVNKIVDDYQEFLTLGAKIFQAASSITGAAGSLTGGSDMGITQGVSQLFGIISSVISAINSTIDLVQEGIRIAGKYVGRWLKSTLGLAGVPGDVKFLLDTNTGVLKSYSAENPLDKQERRGYNLFGNKNPQQIRQNNLTVYGGPGQDPRDTMNDAMWAVSTAGAGVYGYD